MPHKANQYRPHLVRRYGLTAVMIAVVGMQIGYNVSVAGNVLGEQTASLTAQHLLDATNKERIADGKSLLKRNEQLSRAASLKAQDMLQKQYWAHSAPDGVTPWKWFQDIGYQYSLAGENLARDFKSAGETVSAWMASPQHKANVLGAYSDVGFAIASGKLEGKDATIIVALYGSPVGAMPVVQTSSSQPLSLIGQLGVMVQTLSPAVLGSLVITIIAALVALLAHVYRMRLPKSLRDSWYRHHGLLKAGGLLGVSLLILVLQTGGQI